MKRSLIVFIGLILTGFSYGQIDDEFTKEVRSYFWGAVDKHKDVTEVPEKWKDESAVIIYQKILYQYVKKSRKRTIESEAIRRRIKLLDQSAVDEYSEFTISNAYKGRRTGYFNMENNIAELKIIKPDGTVKKVDMAEAIPIDGKSNSDSKKIAISGLERGDILDFYYFSANLEPIWISKSFDAVYTTLNSEYPIMEQELRIELDDKYTFYFKSYNGAPELTSKRGKDGKSKIYTLKDSNREKREDIRWFYPKRELESVKFQAHYVAHEKTLDKAEKRSEFGYVNLLGEPGKVHSGLSPNYLTSRYKEGFEVQRIPRLKKSMEKKFGGLNDKKKILNYLYDEERYSRIMRMIEPLALVREEIKVNIYDDTFNGFPSAHNLMWYMAKVCRTLDIDFEVLLVAPRAQSNFENLLNEEEIDFLIKANLKDGPVYMSAWYVFSEFNQIPKYLEGSDALSLKINEEGEVVSGKTIVVPISTHRDNATIKNIALDLSDLSVDQFAASRTTAASGHSKDYYQTELLTEEDYLSHENKYLDKEWYLDRAVLKNTKERERVTRKYRGYQEAQRKQQRETVMAVLENETSYSIEEFKDYEMLSTGRLDQKLFKYKEEYTIGKSFLKRAGKNYLIPIGSLIDEQVAVKEEEVQRTNNIYMPYARSFDYNISISLPEGYVVEGLDKLNTSVENSTGGFKSEAKMDGQVLKLSCNKWYANVYEDKADWPKLLAFLNAAFQFSQEKVLLKKS